MIIKYGRLQEIYEDLEAKYERCKAHVFRKRAEQNWAWVSSDIRHSEWQAAYNWNVLLREEIKRLGGWIPELPSPYIVMTLLPRHPESKAEWELWKKEREDVEMGRALKASQAAKERGQWRASEGGQLGRVSGSGSGSGSKLEGKEGDHASGSGGAKGDHKDSELKRKQA